jgi:hypothetical protein
VKALGELTHSLGPFLAANPAYKKAFEIVQVPERVLQFRVTWEDDQGQAQVNRGYRVQASTGCTALAAPRPIIANRVAHSTTPPWARTKAGCASIRA